MSIPDNFNPFEHLQQTYKTEFNRRVDRYFKDINSTGDLSSPRASLKLACRITDNDNDTAVAAIKAKATTGATAWKNASTATIKKSYKFTPEGI